MGMACAMMAVFVAILCVRIFCAFTFPIPWNDESDFIAQAFELSRKGTFFVYGMNSERNVMWMPPAYMIVLAGVFKTFGYSFDAARWTSAALFSVTYAVNLLIIGRSLQRKKLILALLASLIAFLSPYSLAIANIARMEALYTLVLMLALMFATVGKRPWIGFSLVLATGLIHFNAVYFAVPFVVYFCDQWFRGRTLEIDRIDVTALVGVGILLSSYLLYVLLNWQGFVDDMRFQFAFKSMGPAFFGIKGLALVAFAYLTCVLLWIGIGRFSDSIFIAGFGAGFILMYIYGKNMWYTYAECLGFYLLVVAGMVGLKERPINARQLFKLFTILSALALVYFSLFRITPTFAPLWPRAELFERDYLAAVELEKVSDFIRATPPGTRLLFGHSGIEPFFFEQITDRGLVWLYPVHSVTQPLPLRAADYLVQCDSALLPKYLLVFELVKYPRKGEDTGCNVFAL